MAYLKKSDKELEEKLPEFQNLIKSKETLPDNIGIEIFPTITIDNNKISNFRPTFAAEIPQVLQWQHGESS